MALPQGSLRLLGFGGHDAGVPLGKQRLSDLPASVPGNPRWAGPSSLLGLHPVHTGAPE